MQDKVGCSPSFTTETLICHWDSPHPSRLLVDTRKFCVACASKMQEMGERGQTSSCCFTEPCSRLCTWSSLLWAHHVQANLDPQLSLMSLSLAGVTPADLASCPSLACTNQVPVGELKKKLKNHHLGSLFVLSPFNILHMPKEKYLLSALVMLFFHCVQQ